MYPRGYKYPWGYMYPGDTCIPADTCIPGDTCILRDTCIPGDTRIPGDTCIPIDSHAPASQCITVDPSASQCIAPHPSASQCIPVHPNASQCMGLHQTPSDSHPPAKVGDRWKTFKIKLIFGGIEGSSGEVSAKRSRIFGSRPNFNCQKMGCSKRSREQFPMVAGETPKNDDGRSFCPPPGSQLSSRPPVATTILKHGSACQT